MGSISATSGTQSTRGVAKSAEASTATSGASEFELFFKATVKAEKSSQVNEEELFAGLVKQRLENSKGSEVATEYQGFLDQEVSSRTKANGFIPYEDAAKAALSKLQQAGKVTDEETQKVYSESFQAAQLDDNKDALYDGRGGAGDPTVSLAELAFALQQAETICSGYDAGTNTAPLRSFTEASNSKPIPTTPTHNPGSSLSSITGTSREDPVDGPDGFLFKPVSSNEGTVAVLLPPAYAYNVSEVLLTDEDGNVLDRGVSTGYGDTGEREKFRFPKPGSEYPNNISVDVILTDGSVKSFPIEDPSQRYD
jgi:hypothetical protein